MENPAQELIKSILEELKAIAKTETIVGEPITIGDKTIVPVCKITLGFGAGGGTGGAKDKGEGSGSGGGGGVAIFPAAFIVIKGDEVSVLGVKPGKWEYILEAIPGIIEKFREGKKGKKEKEEKTE
ncbi:MAG: spore germination protein GerW family protein [candidate division Zixibacteria bacterium]|nr:spore germination protein GerW family protein [candidate division Zixibacteria bacterium]